MIVRHVLWLPIIRTNLSAFSAQLEDVEWAMREIAQLDREISKLQAGQGGMSERDLR
jgi:hypothetical protein